VEGRGVVYSAAEWVRDRRSSLSRRSASPSGTTSPWAWWPRWV